MHSIEERITRLERSARRWRVATCALAATAAMLVASGANQSEPTELTCKSLRIVDGLGNTRALWATDNDSHDLRLFLWNERSEPAGGWIVSSDASSLHVGPSSTGVMLAAHWREKPSAAVCVNGPHGMQAINLRVGDDQSELQLYGPAKSGEVCAASTTIATDWNGASTYTKGSGGSVHVVAARGGGVISVFNRAGLTILPPGAPGLAAPDTGDNNNE